MLAEVEHEILKEWCDFLVSSQDIKVDLFGKSSFLIESYFFVVAGVCWWLCAIFRANIIKKSGILII